MIDALDAAVKRFIPTHVGNTLEKKLSRNPMAVHPHARGEHSATWASVTSKAGSSPRTWGTRFGAHVGIALGRFIPTHVGNTAPAASARLGRTVHPHARGEHLHALQMM